MVVKSPFHKVVTVRETWERVDNLGAYSIPSGRKETGFLVPSVAHGRTNGAKLRNRWFRQLAIFAPKVVHPCSWAQLKTMAESASYSTEVQTSGGLRIEVSPDALTITSVTSILTWLLTYLTYGAFFYLSYVLVSGGRPSPVLLFLLAALVLQYFVLGDIVGVQSLRFTRENLEVIDIFRFRPTRTKSYKRDDVREIRVGAVTSGRCGNPIAGLIFEVGDEQFKAFYGQPVYGLRGREAQKIVEELQRLGFHLSHDPAMP